MSHIKTAIFPVAGLGTRFLPITKSVPKELLPLIDKPLIQYAVDEAREAGVERIVLVSSPEKQALEDYFRPYAKLESQLLAKRKMAELQAVRASDLGEALSVTYQDTPLGLGHAVWTAREFVGDAPFAVILPDDFIHASRGCLSQMIAAHADNGGNMIATVDVGRDRISAYGCLDVVAQNGRLLKAKGMVEKPDQASAPSSQAVIGRYILQPSVMERLGTTAPGAGGEIQLTDAISSDLAANELYGFAFDGTRYDCGSKAGFLEATIAVARERMELVPALRSIEAPLGSTRIAA